MHIFVILAELPEQSVMMMMMMMMMMTGCCSGSSDVQDVLAVWVQWREHVILDSVRGAETWVSSGCCRRESAIHLWRLYLHPISQRGLLQ